MDHSNPTSIAFGNVWLPLASYERMQSPCLSGDDGVISLFTIAVSAKTLILRSAFVDESKKKAALCRITAMLSGTAYQFRIMKYGAVPNKVTRQRETCLTHKNVATGSTRDCSAAHRGSTRLCASEVGLAFIRYLSASEIVLC